MSADPTRPSTDRVEWAKALVADPLSEEATHGLIELLRCGQIGRAKMAAWALGFGEIPEHLRGDAIRALLELMSDITQPSAVRAQAAEAAAGQLEYSETNEPLRVTAETLLVDMLNDPQPEVRFWSAFGLGTLRTAGAVPVLRRLTADTALVPQWWTVGEEAVDAIDLIEGRVPRER